MDKLKSIRKLQRKRNQNFYQFVQTAVSENAIVEQNESKTSANPCRRRRATSSERTLRGDTAEIHEFAADTGPDMPPWSISLHDSEGSLIYTTQWVPSARNRFWTQDLVRHLPRNRFEDAN